METAHNSNSANSREPEQTEANQALPLVSVLIRSADRNFLAQALDSVALQTYPNIEVVVLAVRPHHGALLNQCGRFPLRLVRTDHPVMRSAAANRALAEAQGDFLIFLDDDDWMMPDHVARLADVLIKMPQTYAAYSGIELVDVTGQSMGQAFDLPFDPVRQIAGNLTPIHAVLFRHRALALGCHFDESLDQLEDWDFWLQISKLAPMVHLPGISAVYRIHQSSGVHTDPGPEGASTQRIYQKWEPKWTPQQVGQIMYRVWTYPEMEGRLTDALQRLGLAQQGLGANQSVIAEQMACIAQQASAMAQQASAAAQQAMALAQQQLQITALTQQVQAAQASLAHCENERAAILNSRIWRMTLPLRKIGAFLKRLRLARFSVRVRRLPHALGAESHIAEIPAQAMCYEEWVKTHDTLTDKEIGRLRRTMSDWQHKPLISIVMPVYNPPLDLLEAAITSIQEQIYQNWEICIADDASLDTRVWELLEKLAVADDRIKAIRRTKNGHISQASNTALELANGEFIALMDNDDLLPPDALYWVVEAVNQYPEVRIIYTDEDRLDEHGERYGAYFKPDWNYTLFLGHNMISHLGVYHTQLVRDVGGFRKGLEGSQDYDLALRCIEKIVPSQIVHIPKVLYHWRAVSGSTALSIDAKSYALDAAQRALQEHLVRTGSSARVEQLPSLDYRCVRSSEGLMDGLTVVVIFPNGDSQDAASSAWTMDPAFHVNEVLMCAAHGAAINKAVASAKGELIAVIRLGLCPTGPEALLELAGYALEGQTGVAAGTVRDACGTLVSGGLILNQDNIASVLHKGLPPENHGYAGRGFLSQELSAVCLDCVVFRKTVFDTYGGFDEDLGLGTIGAVAWSLRLREKGLKTIWCPNAIWKTSEVSVVPTREEVDLQRKIFKDRYEKFAVRWLLRDPAYHPRLNPVLADFSLLT